MLELKEKLIAVETAGKPAAVGGAPGSWNDLERDVLSALQNLGCSRAAAEEAVRKVKQRGAPDGFEPFFRAAMAIVR